MLNWMMHFQVLWLFLVFGFLPTTVAISGSGERPFPELPFKLFSDFIFTHFSSNVSLATVLLVLFTITDNNELLSLHARQQKSEYPGEYSVEISGWMKALANAMTNRLEERTETLFKKNEWSLNEDRIPFAIGTKLDGLAKLLKLFPYNKEGVFKGKLKPVSHSEIQPVLVICPDAVVCQSFNCNPRSLCQNIRDRDIPIVNLIKGRQNFQNVPVLTGKCPSCNTTYSADHERFIDDQNEWNRVYLNSARYIKVGQNTWVDREFSTSVLNGIYSFHASAAAYTEYWNNSFGTAEVKITRRHVWQAFVQESIRTISAASNLDLELKDGLAIEDVTTEAFSKLGDNGFIRAAHEHACPECTQPYKETADIIPISENQDSSDSEASNMELDHAPVKMVVLDGIVMGPTHCAFDNCTADLDNSRGGAFCATHEIQFGAKCRVRNCQNNKVNLTQACNEHQSHWKKHIQDYNQHNMAGVRRMLQRPNENLPWSSIRERNHQPHDQNAPEVQQRPNYFRPARFYCVETITAPCGIVIAWAKFARSESPTHIMSFLASVYPTEESRPDYICIDKACLVLRHCIRSGDWDEWKKTSRFIVDSYHYTNHEVTDELCRKWCNPAPTNGSAPNLVVVAYDKSGKPYYKRAFNTQACEQLNSWLGGFESILKRMKPGNFNWFLHTMLFYHTQKVLSKAEEKMKRGKNESDDEDDSSENEVDNKNDGEDDNMDYEDDNVDNADDIYM